MAVYEAVLGHVDEVMDSMELPAHTLALLVQSIIVRVVTRDHAERLQYHAHRHPLRALNILREAGGLQPFWDEHEDHG